MAPRPKIPAVMTSSGGIAIEHRPNALHAAERARLRRKLVFQLVCQGYDEYAIAAALTEQYAKENPGKPPRNFTPHFVRADIAAMRDLVKSRIIKTDPWGEVAEHSAVFEEIARSAMETAGETDDPKVKAEMFRVAMSSRRELINLQLETGIIERHDPKRGANEDQDLKKKGLDELRAILDRKVREMREADEDTDLPAIEDLGPDPVDEGQDDQEDPDEETDGETATTGPAAGDPEAPAGD